MSVKVDGRTLRFKDRTGERFGRLVVVRLVDKRRHGESRWLCRCDCGAEKEVAMRQLLRSHVQSCGCLGREAIAGSPGANKLAPGEASFRTLFGQYVRSARYRGLPFELTRDQFRALTLQNCTYCGGEPRWPFMGGPKVNGPWVCNGVDRFHNDQGYTVENSRPCCTECNMAKGAMGATRWLAWLTRVSIHRARRIKGRDGEAMFIERDPLRFDVAA